MLELLLLYLLMAGAAAVVVAVLNWERIRSWFRERSRLKNSDPNNIAVLVKQALDDGKYSVVTGIYNQETQQTMDAQEFRADRLDAETERITRSNDVVIVQ